MTKRRISAVVAVACLLCTAGLRAQSAPAADSSSEVGVVPRVIKYSGAINPRSVQSTENESATNALTAVVSLTFSLYELQDGGGPLWSETQRVQMDSNGRYTVILGATVSDGLPLDLFTSGKALWLGVQPELPGAVEQPRVLLVAVPYALKASDSDTLGGKPASAYALAGSVLGVATGAVSGAANGSLASGATPSPAPAPAAIQPGAQPETPSKGVNNTATGYDALINDTTGSNNTADGYGALFTNNTGYFNTGTGEAALTLNTSGYYNTADGGAALFYNTTGSFNTASGAGALQDTTTGSNNTATGYNAGLNLTGGSSNIMEGSQAGLNFKSTESNNIDIGNQGMTGESGVIRVGTPGTQTATYIAGISGVAPSGTPLPVVINSSGQLGTGTSSAGTITGVTAGAGLAGGGTSGNVTLSVPSAGVTDAMLANAYSGVGTCTTGKVVSGLARDAAPTCVTAGTGTVTSVATGAGLTGGPITSSGTLSIASGGVTNAMLQSSSLTVNTGTGLSGGGSVALGGTLSLSNTGVLSVGTTGGSGILVSGTAANPSLSADTTVLATNSSVTSAVSGGVTTAEGFATTAANNAQSTAEGFASTAANNAQTAAETFAAGAANSAQSTAETFATGAANTAQSNSESYASSSFLPLAGGTLSGGLTGTTASFSSTVNASAYQIGGSNVLSVPAFSGYQDVFVGPGAGSSNTFGRWNTGSGVNALASNTTGTSNTASGAYALQDNVTGYSNTASGADALQDNTTGNSNTASGVYALVANTTGSNNTASGDFALQYNSSGNYNTASRAFAGQFLGLNTSAGGSSNTLLGYQAGYNFSNDESNNIDVGNEGVTGESGVIRIGTTGTQTATYIAGISGASTMDGLTTVPVLVDQYGTLGTIQSSRRYKEDIHDMAGASDGLLRLRPVTFRYKKPNADGSKPIQYGLIAEEVAKVYPDLVVRNKDGQIETVQYYKLDAMLLNEVQKLSKAHSADQAEVQKLAEAHAADQAEIARLQSQVAEQAKQGQEQQAAMTQLLAQVHGIQLSLASGRSAHSGRSHSRVTRTAARHANTRSTKVATKAEVKQPSGQPLPSLVAKVRF